MLYLFSGTQTSILFYSILFHSIPFHSIPPHPILFYSVHQFSSHVSDFFPYVFWFFSLVSMVTARRKHSTLTQGKEIHRKSKRFFSKTKVSFIIRRNHRGSEQTFISWLIVLYFSVLTSTLIGQFSRPYLTLTNWKFKSLSWLRFMHKHAVRLFLPSTFV